MIGPEQKEAEQTKKLQKVVTPCLLVHEGGKGVQNFFGLRKISWSILVHP
jgi:hypothetical protein